MFSQISREKKMKPSKALIFLWVIMISISNTTTLTMGHRMNRNHLNDNGKSMLTHYNGTKNNNYNDDYNNENVNDNHDDNHNHFTTMDLQAITAKEPDLINGIQNLWSHFNDHVISDITTTTRNAPGSRTFGKIRKLQQLLVPLAFKFGILFSMITFLLLLSLKTFFLLKVLILINVVAILSKFFTLKSSTDDQYSHILSTHGHYGGSAWTPHQLAEYPAFGKEVHLYIHGNGVGGGGGSGGIGIGDSNGIHENIITTSSHLSNIIPSYHSSPNGWKRNSQTITQDYPKSLQ